MKLLLKNKQLPPKVEAAPAVSTLADLKAQLLAAQAAAEEYIETVAQKEKANSPLQPLEWHRLNLRLRFGRSALDCALALLDQEKT